MVLWGSDTTLDFSVIADSAICVGLIANMKIACDTTISAVRWNTGSTSFEINEPITGADNNFWVEITNKSKCFSDTVDINIKGINEPICKLTVCSNNLFCRDEIICLQVEGGVDYEWNTLETTSSIQFVAESDATYSVNVYGDSINHSICFTSLSIDVLVSICNHTIFFPTAFNPSSSVAKNAVFKPIGYPEPKCTYQLIIYNNWGHQIFESNDFATGWDGTFSGKPVERGTYVYVFRTTERLNTREQTGTVTVIE
jgi:gliding motility-associated-like protein